MTPAANFLRFPSHLRKFTFTKSRLPTYLHSGVSKLTSTRRLILVHGVDAPKYLQGVTTNNIPELTATNGTYTCLLNPKGRVLFDVFIYPINHSNTWRSSVQNPNDPGFILECDANSVSNLISHIKRYKLRAKFACRPLEPGTWDVWCAWHNYPKNSYPSDSTQVGAVDARAPQFGYRYVQPDNCRPEVNVDEVSAEIYKLRRILHGIAEGQSEIHEGVALPQESCIDFMGGIDFHKGCYLGQELTIRTHHLGVVRKRILPVQLYPEPLELPSHGVEYNPTIDITLPPESSDIWRIGTRPKKTGKFIGGIGNVGLALCRIESMTGFGSPNSRENRYAPTDEFSVNWDGQSVRLQAFVPEWYQNKL